MTLAERNIHILDLQIRHASPYSSSLYNRLITGGCADLKENSQIAYMIKLWYRYEPLTDAEDASMTDAQKEVALDARNCLTFCEMATIKAYLLKLLTTC